MGARKLIAPHGREEPVLLVSGLGCPSRALQPLARRIQRRLGRPTVCLPEGLGFEDIRDTAARLHESLERMARERPLHRIDVVAHSMGGLVAAYLLKCLDHGRRVRCVVALGTPFAGVPAARLGGLLFGPFGRPFRQMVPGSDLLRMLERLPVPAGSTLASLGGTRDWLVPIGATRLPATRGHRHLATVDCDHWGLLLGARSFVRMAGALAAAARLSRQRSLSSRAARPSRATPWTAPDVASLAAGR